MFRRNLVTRRNCLSRQRGATQIEFVLSILITFFVVVWLIELCMAMYTTTVLADAAREGVRYAIVHGINNTSCSGPNTPNCADPDASGTRVKSVVTDIAKFSAHPIADTDVTITYVDGSNTPPNRVRVQINYQYVPWVRLPWTAPQLKAQAEGRIVN